MLIKTLKSKSVVFSSFSQTLLSLLFSIFSPFPSISNLQASIRSELIMLSLAALPIILYSDASNAGKGG